MNHLKTQLVLLVLSTVCLLTGAFGQLTPSGDSYTNTAAPTTNYGAKTTLDVESTQTTFIQFNLESIPSGYTSADITKATLKLFVDGVTTAGSFNVDYVNGTWSESTIDASNAPALGTTIAASVPLTTKDKDQYILVDVTAAVQAWLGGTPNDGIALVANSPLSATFDSKEATKTSHTAELDIVFAGGGTLTGITTASGSGLTGGGTSGTLNLSLTNTCAASQVLQYNGSSWVCAAVGTGTITGVTAGTDLTGGGTSGNVTLSLNTAATNALYAQLGAANTFTGNQTVTGTLASTAASVNGVGIEGNSSAATGTGVGVGGGTNSATGYGVEGVNNATTGTAPGVFGLTYSTAGYGVQGQSPNIGVYGTGSVGVDGVTNATLGYGVAGYANATTGSASGVFGATYTSSGGGIAGVVGTSYATTGTTAGVFGASNSPAGYGVQGAGPSVGVYGTGTSQTGIGLEGSGPNAGVYGIGVAYGVEGSATSSTGVAGLFQVSSSSAAILKGVNNGTVEFSVDAAGDVSGNSFQIAGQTFAFGNYSNANAFLGFAGSGNTNATAVGDTAVGFLDLSEDTGGYNTVVGFEALGSNTTGTQNTALGSGAGETKDASSVTGYANTALGAGVVFSTGSLTNATAIGSNAYVSSSNALVLGSFANSGICSGGSCSNTNVGIGTSAPTAALDVVGNSLQALIGDPVCGSGFAGIGFVNKGGFNSCTNYALLGDVPGNLYVNSSLSGTIYFRNNNGTLMTINSSGHVGIGTTAPDNTLSVNGSADKPGGGSWGTFSDARLKTVNGGFTDGLSQIMKIQPIHYRYKPGNAMGIRDTDEHIGVVAQDVQRVIPEAVTENSKGYLLVNNDPIIWTMLNAIKEQQGEIRALKSELRATRQSLQKVQAQVVRTQPALVAAR